MIGRLAEVWTLGVFAMAFVVNGFVICMMRWRASCFCM